MGLFEEILKRTTGILTGKVEAFEDLKASPRWEYPLVFLVLLGIGISFFTYSKFEASERVADSFFETETLAEENSVMLEEETPGAVSADTSESAPDQPTPEEKLKFSQDIVKLMVIVAPLIGTLLSIGAISLVFFASVKLLGGEMTFIQSMGVTSWSQLAMGIKGVIYFIIILFAEGGKDVDIPVFRSNLGFLASTVFSWISADSAVGKLLEFVDLFSIWFVLIAGIGISVISGIKRGVAISSIFLLWILWIYMNSGLPVSP